MYVYIYYIYIMLVLLFNPVVKATGKRQPRVSWLILHLVWILEPFRISLVSCPNSAMPVVSIRS